MQLHVLKASLPSFTQVLCLAFNYKISCTILLTGENSEHTASTFPCTAFGFIPGSAAEAPFELKGAVIEIPCSHMLEFHFSDIIYRFGFAKGKKFTL